MGKYPNSRSPFVLKEIPLRRLSLIHLLSLLFLLPIIGYGQTHRGAIRGLVLDPNEAAIPGASIRLTNQETGETRTVTSDDNGAFTLTALAPGAYQLETTAQGVSKLITRVSHSR